MDEFNKIIAYIEETLGSGVNDDGVPNLRQATVKELNTIQKRLNGLYNKIDTETDLDSITKSEADVIYGEISIVSEAEITSIDKLRAMRQARLDLKQAQIDSDKLVRN